MRSGILPIRLLCERELEFRKHCYSVCKSSGNLILGVLQNVTSY